MPTDDKIGTPLRDAATDPHEQDHQAPVNAGKDGALGNPHGPSVVSIQALSPRSGNPPAVGEPEPN